VGKSKSHCDLINDDNKLKRCVVLDFYYKRLPTCDICLDTDAGAVERTVGMSPSQCDLINDDNKSSMCDFYFKNVVKCAICHDTDAGAVEKAVSYSGPSKDCYSFDKDCPGCRGNGDSCCSDKNCASGRQCKAGIFEYTCTTRGAQEERAVGKSKSHCDLINDDNKLKRCVVLDFYYKRLPTCDICLDTDAGAVERAVGTSPSQCDLINADNKFSMCDFYFKNIVKCSICQDTN